MSTTAANAVSATSSGTSERYARFASASHSFCVSRVVCQAVTTYSQPPRQPTRTPATQLFNNTSRLRLRRWRPWASQFRICHARSTSQTIACPLCTSDEAVSPIWRLTLLCMCLCVAEHFSGMLTV